MAAAVSCRVRSGIPYSPPMHPLLGWALAGLLLAIAWQGYGWRGLLVAFTAIVFWLLLQFNRALRVMKNAGQAPVGHVPSAVMLNAKLKPGMTMLQVVTMTKSLGRQLDDAGERWQWQDEGGSRVTLQFARGKLVHHELERPSEAPPAADGAPQPGP